MSARIILLPVTVVMLGFSLVAGWGGSGFAAQDVPAEKAACPEPAILPSPVLSPVLKERIASELTSLCEYLVQVGIRPDPRPLEIAFSPSLIDTAYYRRQKHRIVVASSLAADTEVILRQYVHAALCGVVDEEVRPVYVSLFPSVHSGAVSYFLASFHDDPVSKGITGKHTLDVAHISRLDHDWTYPKLSDQVVWPEKRDLLSHVWGAVFWDIRREIGREKADRLLCETLGSVQRSDFRADDVGRFPRRLLHAARRLDGGRHVATIENILRVRAIPMPQDGD